MLSVRLYLFSLYGLFGSILSTLYFTLDSIDKSYSSSLTLSLSFLGLFFLLALILTLTMLVQSATLVIKEERTELIKRTKYLKFGSVPFFIVNFILLTVSLLLFTAVTRGLGILVVPFFIGATYILMLGTSTYSIAFTLLLRRLKVIDTSSTIIHILLQLNFVLDVLGLLILVRKNKTHSPSSANPTVPKNPA